MTNRPSSPAPSRRAALIGTIAALVMPRIARAQAPRAAAVRIVSLGGAVTEILYGLGAGARIAAVDTTSLFPAEALRDKPNVGYLRALSAEGILSVRPDLVMAAEGAGPADVLTLVREAGVPVTIVRDPPTAEGVLDKIAAIGRLSGLEQEAAALGARVEGNFTALAQERARIARPVKALVVLSVQNGRIMVGGRGSTADGILALAGAANAASGIEGFKPITDEAIVAAAPEVVVTMRTGRDDASPDTVFGQAALGQTPAAAKRTLIAMDGLYLLGFGPRTPDAARDLLRAFYPDLNRG